MQWLAVLPLEIIAASLTINYWNDQLSRAIFVTIFLSTIVLINLFGVKGYGEAEFTFSLIKVTAVIGFMYVQTPTCLFSPKTNISLACSALCSTVAARPIEDTLAEYIGWTQAHSTTASKASAASS